MNTPTPLDMLKTEQEVLQRYRWAAPEIREYILWTARTFGQSGLWLNEDAFDRLPNKRHEERIVYLSKLFIESEYGRYLCQALAEASALKDPRLVPGLMKVAAYRRDDADYDCRAKWMAVAALARQGSHQAIPLLISLVDHGNQNTRKWARAALARLIGQDLGENRDAWYTCWEVLGQTGAGTVPQREADTEMLAILIDEDEVKRVSVSVGLTPDKVLQRLHPAEILSDDEPMVGCRAVDGGMYILYFLPDTSETHRVDRLAALAKFSPARPGNASSPDHTLGVFLLPEDRRG